MSVQVTDRASVVAVRRFVDGSLAAGVFEPLLRTDAALRAYLSAKEAPSVVGGPMLRYLRGLDWTQPKDVLEAQRALVRLLIAVGEDVAPTDRYERRARLFDRQVSLWSRVQPTWLSIPATYFATLLEECEHLPEDSLEKTMKAKVRTLFRYQGRPPVWLHDETWPVNANGPMTFVEQLDVSGPYDTSYRYVFRDEKSHERHELVQSTARFEPTTSPLPASAMLGSRSGLDFPMAPVVDDDSVTVPMPVLEALADALEALDIGPDDAVPVVPIPVAEPYHRPADPRPLTRDRSALRSAPPSAAVYGTREVPSSLQPWVDPVSLVADDPTKPVVPPPTRWALELDGGRSVELWASSVVLGRSPQASGPQVQRLAVTHDPSLLDTHARLELIYGSWWVTNLSADGGVTVVGARGGPVVVPTGMSVPVRTHLGLGSVTFQLVPLSGGGPHQTVGTDGGTEGGPDESTAPPVEMLAPTGLHVRPAASEPRQSSPWAPAPALTASAAVDDVEATVRFEPSFDPWTLTLDDGRSFVVRARTVVVGRRPTASVPGVQALAVADATRTLSRTHAQLDLVGGEWRVTDLGSTNGVLVTDVHGGQKKAEPGNPTPVRGFVAFGSVEARLVAGRPGLG